MQSVVKNTSERGDTLIEVLVAISVFGIIVVGTFSLMNRGASQMYDSMERSEVRLLLNGQTELLTYARDEYFQSLDPEASTSMDTYDTAAKTVWNPGIRNNVTNLTGVPSLEGCSSDNDATNAFWLTTETNGTISIKSRADSPFVSSATGFPSPGNGIWIQKIHSPGGVAVPYVDFYIRACWMPTSSSQTQVLSTIVRLYDQ